MRKQKLFPVIMALVASILFGASTPLTKMLLGEIQPVSLAAFLYLGSGFGLSLILIINFIVNMKTKKQRVNEAPLKKKDYLWLLGATITGGIIAPVILLNSLQFTPSSTASLLLNFESVATALIAIIIFKENAGRQIISAVILITFAGILLSWNVDNQWGISMGAVGIMIACFCWGADNNFTRNISAKNPFAIVAIKGIAAGGFNLFLSFLLHMQIPDLKIVLGAMLIGFFCYGLSIVLFVFAMRYMGSTRTSALFGMAPFIGAALSFALLNDTPDMMFIASVPLMIIGAVLLVKEKHGHVHLHKAAQHEHRHCHDDNHHNHTHNNKPGIKHGYHSHMHVHPEIMHSHPHAPDTDHRHSH
jgi:Permeases of the drug/metabolite transporter (DMT) superfamily